jgi:hypothetical protein
VARLSRFQLVLGPVKLWPPKAGLGNDTVLP